MQFVEFDQPIECLRKFMPMARRSGRRSQMPKGEDAGVCSAGTLHIYQEQQEGVHESSKHCQLDCKLDCKLDEERR